MYPTYPVIRVYHNQSASSAFYPIRSSAFYHNPSIFVFEIMSINYWLDQRNISQTLLVFVMGSQLFFQIVSPFFQIGSFMGSRYHDFFKRVSRFLQIILSLLKQKVIHFI